MTSADYLPEDAYDAGDPVAHRVALFEAIVDSVLTDSDRERGLRRRTEAIRLGEALVGETATGPEDLHGRAHAAVDRLS